MLVLNSCVNFIEKHAKMGYDIRIEYHTLFVCEGEGKWKEKMHGKPMTKNS